MVNNEKIMKQKNSLRSGINIRFALLLAGLAGLIWACDTSFATVVGIYLSYKLLKLILRIFGLVVSLFISVVLAVALIVIISLLIF
jgi:hypothetical protein